MAEIHAPVLTEADYQQRLIDTAHRLGWLVHHTRAARTASGWRTPVQGDRGFPDLVLARDGQIIVAEIKGPTGRLGPGQREWLDALGGHGRLWRPSGWAAALAELKRTTGRTKQGIEIGKDD